MGKYEFHEAASIMPMMSAEKLQELRRDIDANGQMVDIAICEKKILDGRNRYRACEIEPAIAPKFMFVYPDDPIAYVHTHNVKRRQLSKSELGMVAARSVALYEKRAKERKRAGNQKGGKKSKDPRTLPSKVTQVNRKSMTLASSTSESAEETATELRSVDKIAKDFGVGATQVVCCQRVIGHGSPQLVGAVDDQKIAPKAARALTYLSFTQQDEAVGYARSGKKGDIPKLHKLAAKADAKHRPGKAKKQKLSSSQLVDDTVKNINKLIALVEGSDTGMAKIRERIISNAKIARTYVKDTETYVTS